MKRLPKYFLISLATFLIGLVAAAVWFFSNQNTSQQTKPEITIVAGNPLAKVNIEAVKPEEDKFRTSLDKLWIEDEKIYYEGYKITKKCAGTGADNDCFVKIIKNKKTLEKFETSREYWIRYALFNFLGENDKQLIVHTYSGGAHCCYDYVIYDLKPTFRVVYDSSKFDDSVGDELIPVDIDGDGIFEFQQDVMAFDYMAPGGHATSTFPPAVFTYDKRKMRYDFANRKFASYVLDNLRMNLDGLDEWAEESKKRGTEISPEEISEITARETFLYLVYAGMEDKGWKHFNEKYNFQFREKFKKEFKEQFSEDPTYKSIYAR